MQDLTGLQIGRWKVLSLLPKDGRQRKWLCECSCEAKTQRGVFSFMLHTKRSLSCGCVAAEKSKERWSVDQPELRKKLSENSSAATHRMSKHPAFRSWADMKSRCLTEKHKWFPSYGGRGIKIHDKWVDSFESFWSDMSDTWFQGAQLGRIDNDGDYEPANCRWETATQQQRNKTNTIYVNTPSGVMQITEASEKFGVSAGCLLHRHKQNYSPTEMVKPSERSK